MDVLTIVRAEIIKMRTTLTSQLNKQHVRKISKCIVQAKLIV